MPRTRKSPLSRETVVDAAISMIGEAGLEAFSMPKLAAALSVSAPSLYHHFAGKEDLLAAVARTVATPQPPPELPADAHWSDYLIETAVVLRRTIVAHPHCAPLLVRYMPKDNMFDEYERVCRFLSAAGVPTRLHVRIVDGMTALTIGAAMLNENAAHYTPGGDGPAANPATHPALGTALEAVGDATADEQFERYLRTYLAGVTSELEEPA